MQRVEHLEAAVQERALELERANKAVDMARLDLQARESYTTDLLLENREVRTQAAPHVHVYTCHVHVTCTCTCIYNYAKYIVHSTCNNALFICFQLLKEKEALSEQFQLKVLSLREIQAALDEKIGECCM